MTKKFVDKMKYGIAGLATLVLSYLPINSYSQNVNKGVSFGVNKIGGEEYKRELTIAHGTPYIFSEVKTSDENSLGVEATPYLMEKAGKRVVYVPKEMNVERIVLKQDGPFGIKGDKNTFTFDYFMNNKNPMGDNVNHTEKNYSRNISTMILPSGDTTYFIYDTTDKDVVANGKKLNFTSVVVGDSVKSDDKGNLYIQSNKGKVYEWVLDESRTNSPTSIDKKVIDTTYFSVIKSNKELTGFKKYETNVAQGEYETIVSGTQDKETKYVVVKSPTKLASLSNAGFKRTYDSKSKKYNYKIEADKVKLEKVKCRNDLIAINGNEFKKKSVTSKTETTKVPFNKKITVSGMIHEYTVPVGDLKNLKYNCDSCGASSKYKIDTTNVTENLVLNPGYPSKYLNKFGTNTTGEVEKIILSDGPAKKPAKEKKSWNMPAWRTSAGAGVSVSQVNPNKYNENSASAFADVQVEVAKDLWLGAYAELPFAGSKTIANHTDTTGIEKKLIGYNVYKVDESTIAVNEITTYDFGFGGELQGKINDGLDWFVSGGVMHKNYTKTQNGEKNVYHMRNDKVIGEPVKLTNTTKDKTNEFVPKGTVGLRKGIFNNHAYVELSGSYFDKRVSGNAKLGINLARSKINKK